MKFKLNKVSVLFYSAVIFAAASVFLFLENQNLKSVKFQEGSEKRVIKCELPLQNKMVQNLFFVATDLESARQMLFNSKQGLFFDNKLYVKTVDFEGNKHVVPFEHITCDSIGTQVSLTSL